MTKTRHLKLIILILFCVWEDARVWVYGNHSLDMHLNLPRASILFFSILNAPQGTQWLVAG